MSVVASRKFLDLAALSSLAHMRFATKHRIEGSYSGRHRSRRQGGAAEFVDYREYSAGEDLRRLDWKVLARTGRAYVRLYQDETNLLCTLAIDASGSMQFGAASNSDSTGSKLEYAQYLSTALSHVISRGQDQVGLAVLTDSLADFFPPGSTPTHVAQVQERIEGIQTTAARTMSRSLQQLFERQRARGVLMLMSDFLAEDVEDVFAALRLFRHGQSEVVVLHLIHPDEERLPTGSAWRFDGLEGEGHIDCSPAEIRAAYETGFRAHCELVRAMALAAGCDYRRVPVSVNYLETLGGFLVERAG